MEYAWCMPIADYANILKCTQSRAAGKWNHLEVIKTFVEKHNLLMLRV